MRLPIDIAAHVSPALSAIIDGVINDPDIDAPVTLGVVRKNAAGELLSEIDALIERFGGDALADYLMHYE
ncbi:MAG: hypothetical protein A3G81_24165 [Betaproteobacteria bacterium RIFCSPLOWO2_12_FULL_65_14]|nr:MAG: hypothetical protein A3G81_24165 [Betaproteobacteria bacterium RIFCSPLOWO2_12_FULL_65_14]